MDKRKEIRGGMEKELQLYLPFKYLDTVITDVLNFLHSQGVVIKVEGELPKYQKTWGNDGDEFYDCFRPTTPKDLYGAGYTLTEPLVEE